MWLPAGEAANYTDDFGMSILEDVKVWPARIGAVG